MGRPSVAEQGEEEEEGGESLRSSNDACNLKHYAKHWRVISHIWTHCKPQYYISEKYGRFGLGDEDQTRQIIK